ncbi:EF-hand domain-containing protein [Sphingomonas sp. R-74633]|uniref:EF-hand domain-containing protein n=1 Tax=Sphingomonas sp. R-74633 TaxID=2751188 RepID=UPI0015D0DD72|nr:EF-hand domain-containing protein [Sphingomonas sp. R-74633]NYT39639.1 EF-hand domain-containing protein [Sphingomonas sp. R-74633]
MMRAPKKSDTIEVRLPHAVKRAFMEHCRAEGRTASDVVRGFVEARLADGPPEPPAPRLRLAVAAAMCGALGMAMPAAVASAPDLRPSFAMADRNHDGLLTPDEYGARPQPPGRECGPHHVLALPLRDGAISHARGMRPFMIGAADFSFAGSDANKDGKVSFTEYAAHRLKMLRAGFGELDANHDGSLTPAEYATAWDIFRFRDDQPDLASFQELDRNGDGKVAWTEFLA